LTTYGQFVRFLLPLVLTMVVQEFGGQVLNGGMARMPQATQTLAGFGLAWGLTSFLTSPLMQVRQLSLVLVNGRSAYGTVRAFVLIAGLLLSGVMASLALSPWGTWLIRDLHGADAALGALTRNALLWLFPVPLLRGITLFYSGLLLRSRRTDLASYAVLASIAASIAAVFVLLPSGLVREQPIRLPVLVTYAGFGVELLVALWAYRRFVGRPPAGPGQALTFGYVLRFFWPLALIMSIQGLSRPLINLFVSREPGGAEALAVLTVTFTLAHLPYGWLNEIRNLAPTFQKRGDDLALIRRFALACGLLSFGLMIVLFWTPLRVYILETLIGIEPALAAQARVPLMIFSLFPLVVMGRAYLHGVGLLEHRTQSMAPSAPARIAAVLVALLVLPWLGVYGASRGVTALLCGFAAEALVVWWGIRVRGQVRALRSA
jgi:hypothetical protein